MRWNLIPHSSGTYEVKLICIEPNDKSWYYGHINRTTIQPDGLGAHYDVSDNYIEGGFWENGRLLDSMTQEEYEYCRNHPQD